VSVKQVCVRGCTPPMTSLKPHPPQISGAMGQPAPPDRWVATLRLALRWHCMTSAASASSSTR
jgi:hypothetical protein